MSKESRREQLSEEQIDEIVVAQAENDAAWEDSSARGFPNHVVLAIRVGGASGFFRPVTQKDQHCIIETADVR